jgi:hypothetical protein
MVQQARERRIDRIFSGSGARADEWRGLVAAAVLGNDPFTRPRA